MIRETPAAYDYEAKGSADFKAGRKDERLYGNAENHGASYRKGWQQARRDAEASQDSRPTPEPVKAPETPVRPKPEDWNGSPGSVSIVQPVEPPPVTRQDVLLHTGEAKPKRPKPPEPDQLAFF